MAHRSTSLAHELKAVIRLAGRDPEALEGRLPTLSALHRVAATGEIDESARLHFILHRLIPEYLDRLPGGRDCRAICELLTWQDADGELLSLTTRYHKAALHLVSAASDFGRRQEPRLLLECARRFIALDHEDRLGSRPVPGPVALDVPVQYVAPAATDVASTRDAEDGIVRVHPNLDYYRLAEYISEAEEVVILNTWIPGIDILAAALADAIARGSYVSILLLHPESDIAQRRSEALQGSARARVRQDMVRPGIEHCLDVLRAVSLVVDDSHRANLRVRLYDSLPSISLYGMDDRAFVGFFMHGQLAIKSVQIETLGQESLMGRCAFQEMATLWSLGHELTDISQWRSHKLTVPRHLTQVQGGSHPLPAFGTQQALGARDLPVNRAIGDDLVVA